MKKLLKLLLFLAAAMPIVAAVDVDDYNADMDMQSEVTFAESQEATSLRGVSRFLEHQKLVVNLTCDKFPRVCRSKGSLGPDCCKKKCVNVKTDALNCNQCGRKCKKGEVCCKGKCVNVKIDARNCNQCGRKCGNGGHCCNGKCVDVKSDALNCNQCGHKCRYREICCKGKCVDAMYDKKNCGACKNKCKKGDLCVNGLCNYA